jgi:hypothetical protein
LPTTSAVSALATREFMVQERVIDRHACGHALDKNGEGGAMAFASGVVVKLCHEVDGLKAGNCARVGSDRQEN